MNPVSKQLEHKLESFLNHEPTLREVQNRRRQQATQDKLTDDKPLSDVLQGLMKTNPILSRLFLQGLNLSNPFQPGGGRDGQSNQFVGQRFPTLFRFKDRPLGEKLTRPAHVGTRTRVAFAASSSFLRIVGSDALPAATFRNFAAGSYCPASPTIPAMSAGTSQRLLSIFAISASFGTAVSTRPSLLFPMKPWLFRRISLWHLLSIPIYRDLFLREMVWVSFLFVKSLIGIFHQRTR